LREGKLWDQRKKEGKSLYAKGETQIQEVFVRGGASRKKTSKCGKKSKENN